MVHLRACHFFRNVYVRDCVVLRQGVLVTALCSGAFSRRPPVSLDKTVSRLGGATTSPALPHDLLGWREEREGRRISARVLGQLFLVCKIRIALASWQHADVAEEESLRPQEVSKTGKQNKR